MPDEASTARGGWTRHTGSASWMFRVELESILGFTRRGDTLRIEPRVPYAWAEFSITYRFGTALYAITVQDPAAIRDTAPEVRPEGIVLAGRDVPLVGDGARHEVLVRPGTSRQRLPLQSLLPEMV